jgi:FtsP/CotA-like multicopper oxidase with cupredoxin domain
MCSCSRACLHHASSRGNPSVTACPRAPWQVEANPELGTTEEWVWINYSPDAHPMHIHARAFTVRDAWVPTGQWRAATTPAPCLPACIANACMPELASC